VVVPDIEESVSPKAKRLMNLEVEANIFHRSWVLANKASEPRSIIY
jgi:hypothetical protein